MGERMWTPPPAGTPPWRQLEGWYDQPDYMKMVGGQAPERTVIPIREVASPAPLPRRRSTKGYRA